MCIRDRYSGDEKRNNARPCGEYRFISPAWKKKKMPCRGTGQYAGILSHVKKTNCSAEYGHCAPAPPQTTTHAPWQFPILLNEKCCIRICLHALCGPCLPSLHNTFIRVERLLTHVDIRQRLVFLGTVCAVAVGGTSYSAETWYATAWFLYLSLIHI